MGKEEILEKLNKAFGDFKFFEEDHHYEYKGERVGVSVTKLIEQYTNGFDAEMIAEKVAIRDGKTIQEVLDEWKYKNSFACEKGQNSHDFAQTIWSGTMYHGTTFDGSTAFLGALEAIFQQARNFHNDFEGKLMHLADEFVIGSAEYDIASAVDHLFVDKATGELVLVDYKTNSDIRKNEQYAKPMKAPLQHLKDTALNHYAIQISIYKYLIEKYTGLEVSRWFIVYMSENIGDYEIIDVPYLKNEVETILEWRIYD